MINRKWHKQIYVHLCSKKLSRRLQYDSMQLRRNLISDSVLVQETADLLYACGGCATAVEIVDAVFKLSHIDSMLATRLVSDLIGADPRFEFIEGSKVNLIQGDHDSRPLAATDFVVMDVEATGARPSPCRIIEIGAYRVTDGKIVAKFETLLNPGTPIPHFIKGLTGISDEMVSKAPAFADIAEDWLDFAGDSVLVAHNAPFDLRVLDQEIGRTFPGQRMRNASLCTIILARHLIPELGRYRLDSVAGHFGIEIEPRHRAASDALATAQILIRLLATLNEFGIADIGGARKFRLNPEGQARKHHSAQLALDV
jgi:DNA polymerase III epsilon subunit family exonuclease